MAFAALTIDLNAQLAKFEQDMKRASTQLDSFGSKASAAAAGLKTAFGVLTAGIGVTGLAAFAKQGIDAADALNDLSTRVGVSVKDLASFKLAAQLADTSLENVGSGIARLSRSIGEAERDNKTMAAALSELGVTAHDPKEAFLQLADGVERINDPSRRATLLNAVLGKSYLELLPLLSQGGDELRRMARESESFAETMARLAPDAGRFNDNLDGLKQQAAAAGGALLERLVPGLSDTAKRVRELLDEDKGFQAFVRAVAGIGRLPFDAIFGDIKPASTSAERIKELNKELAQLKRNLASAGPNSRGGLLGSSDDIRRQILVKENEIAAMQKFGEQIYKKKQDEQKKDEKETVNYGATVQEALRKAFETTAIDDFLAKFKDKRKAISAEYAALRAEIEGGNRPATSLDVSAALTQGRSALSAGNNDAAEAAIKRAKDLFRDLASQEGTASFEESYFLRELERLETDVADKAEDVAKAGVDKFRETIEQANLDAAKLNVQIDEAALVAQVKDIFTRLQRQLNESPLEAVVVPGLRQSVDLSTAARQYGARR